MVEATGSKLNGALDLLGLLLSEKKTLWQEKIDDFIHDAATVSRHLIRTGAVSSADSLRFRRYRRAASVGATHPRAGRRDPREDFAGTHVHRPGGSKRGRACTCAARRPASGTARCHTNGGRPHPITYSERSVSGRFPTATERRRHLAGGVRDILRFSAELYPRRVGTEPTGLRAGASPPERGHDRAVGGNDFPVSRAGCRAQPHALLHVSLRPARRD